MRERNAEPVNRASEGLAMTTKPFNDIYKEWRNRARRYSLQSIVNGALEGLCEPKADLHCCPNKAIERPCNMLF